MKKIAVWNTAFLGDAILTLPLLQNLRLAYPNAQIDFWVRKGLASLLNNLDFVDSVCEFDKRGAQKSILSIYPLSKKLKAQNYDLWISAHTSPRSSLIALLSGAKKRIGYASAKFSMLQKIAYTDLVERNFPKIPEIERLNQLLQPLGLDTPELHPKLALVPESLDIWQRLNIKPGRRAKAPLNLLKPENSESADNLANVDNSSGALIGLHPGSTWGTKRWLPEYFAEIALQAIKNKVRVALFAGPGEEEIAKEVQTLIIKGLEKNNDLASHLLLIDLAGKLKLSELAACIYGLDAYVCNDSGPMHIAWSVGTPTIAIFGPTVPELGFAPRSLNSHVVEVPSVISIKCRPCSKHGPKSCPLEHHNCMKLVSPSLVWDALKQYIA